jgi:hypothetical protein
MKEVTYVHHQTARLHHSCYRCDDDDACGCSRCGQFSQPNVATEIPKRAALARQAGVKPE